MKEIELTSRQQQIIEIVQSQTPITGDQIAEQLHLSKPTIRGDLSLLVMTQFLSAKPKVGYFPGERLTVREPLRTALHDLKVKDVQSVPVVVYEHATIHEAVITLFLEDVGTLLVINNEGRLAGILSRKDLLKMTLGNQDISEVPISMMMTRVAQLVAVTPDDRVIEAAQKMIHHEVDSLPVIRSWNTEEGYEVVGRISKTTITKLVVHIAVE
ncbi:helix-turn-helix transcriptional regulator [Paenibacillus sp. Marseille-Q4541]|uniref:CBS domain-containing protein n=1 Tax=Paenibacillus sp. Marseille-Q4541 TaxID=2831522 RepID=UPI001BAA355C